jgi:hypothetical protein
VRAVDVELASLEREAKVRIEPPPNGQEPENLSAALEKSVQVEIAKRQETIITKTTEANATAVDVVAKAEADRILREATNKAAAILRESNEMLEARRREQEIKDAESKAKDTQTQLASKKISDEANHQKLLAKASDPQVQSKLAPFITAGYLQGREIQMEKKPLSLTVLQSEGALEPTKDGMIKLAHIATTKQDKVRPRMALRVGTMWLKNPEQIEEVKEAQSLLIELGPVLVEKGLLSP